MNPKFLLDSSVCVPVLRNKAGRVPLPAPSATGVPVIVAAELWTGVTKNLGTHPHHGERLEAFLSLFRIPEFTLDAARHYADIRADLELAGNTIGPLDLLIAAQCRSLGATLVTANAREFRCAKGLKLLEWAPEG